MPFILYDVVFFNRLPDTGINSLMSRGTGQPSKFLNDAMYPPMSIGLLCFKFVDIKVELVSKELNHFGGIALFFRDWAPGTLAGGK